jgi:anti-sigma B factor antagonist
MGDHPWRDLPLVLEEEEHDGVRVIAARGELDLVTAPRLASRLDSTRRDGGRRILVDLTGINFCDSTGLRALIGAANEVRAAGGRLAVCAGDGGVARLLTVTGAFEVLEIHPDAAAGLAAFRAG